MELDGAEPEPAGIGGLRGCALQQRPRDGRLRDAALRGRAVRVLRRGHGGQDRHRPLHPELRHRHRAESGNRRGSAHPRPGRHGAVRRLASERSRLQRIRLEKGLKALRGDRFRSRRDLRGGLGCGGERDGVVRADGTRSHRVMADGARVLDVQPRSPR